MNNSYLPRPTLQICQYLSKEICGRAPMVPRSSSGDSREAELTKVCFIYASLGICLFFLTSWTQQECVCLHLVYFIVQLLCCWATDLMPLALGQGQLNPSNKNYKHSWVSGRWVDMFQGSGLCIFPKSLQKCFKKSPLWKCLGVYQHNMVCSCKKRTLLWEAVSQFRLCTMQTRLKSVSGGVEEWAEVTDKSTHHSHFHSPPPCIVKGALIKHPLSRPLCFSSRVDLGLPGLIPSLGDLGELGLNSTLHVNILQARGKSMARLAAGGGRPPLQPSTPQPQIRLESNWISPWLL